MESSATTAAPGDDVPSDDPKPSTRVSSKTRRSSTSKEPTTAEERERRDYKEELRALKKTAGEESRELKKMREQFTVPVVSYDDKEEWKMACKKLEKAVFRMR